MTDPCYRAASLNGPCFRVSPVTSAGFGNGTQFNSGNFPPAESVLVPKGAGVRTIRLERDREAFSAVAQYESPNQDFLVTFEWLRSETTFGADEYSALAQVNDDGLFPVPAAGNTWQFDSKGVFQKGVLSQRIGDAYSNPFGRSGIPLETLRLQRETASTTEDFSVDIDWNITDRLRVNF